MRHTVVEQKKQGRSGLAMLIAGAFVLAGCSPPSTGPSASPGTDSSNNPPVTMATTAVPVPTTLAAYKPATDQGPAQNVPVPVLPEKAKEFSKEGLIAFTEHWYATLGYAFETGDAEPMMTISDSGCKACQTMEKAAIGGHQDGKWIMGGRMVIDPPHSPFAEMDDGTYQALTMARQEQVKFFNADKTVRKDSGVTVAKRDILVARFANEAWVAITVEHVAGGRSS